MCVYVFGYAQTVAGSILLDLEIWCFNLNLSVFFELIVLMNIYGEPKLLPFEGFLSGCLPVIRGSLCRIKVGFGNVFLQGLDLSAGCA